MFAHYKTDLKDGKLLSQSNSPMVLMVGVGSIICFMFITSPSQQQFSMLMDDSTAVQEAIKEVKIVA